MDDESEPLNELYTDEDTYDKRQLVDSLKQYISIKPDNGSVLPKPGIEELTDPQKVVCYLLAQRALYDLDEITESEIPQQPIEVDRWIDIHEADADKICRDLPLIKSSDDHGPYLIPITHIEAGISVIEGSAEIEVEDSSIMPTYDESDFLERSDYS